MSAQPCASGKVCYTYFVRFTWDPKKAASNRRKHGVSFTEAATVFADPLAAMLEDAIDAQRWLMVGQSEKGRVLITVFSEVTEDTIRIISARRATSHERKRYEESDW